MTNLIDSHTQTACINYTVPVCKLNLSLFLRGLWRQRKQKTHYSGGLIENSHGSAPVKTTHLIQWSLKASMSTLYDQSRGNKFLKHVPENYKLSSAETVYFRSVHQAYLYLLLQEFHYFEKQHKYPKLHLSNPVFISLFCKALYQGELIETMTASEDIPITSQWGQWPLTSRPSLCQLLSCWLFVHLTCLDSEKKSFQNILTRKASSKNKSGDKLISNQIVNFFNAFFYYF